MNEPKYHKYRTIHLPDDPEVRQAINQYRSGQRQTFLKWFSRRKKASTGLLIAPPDDTSADFRLHIPIRREDPIIVSINHLRIPSFAIAQVMTPRTREALAIFGLSPDTPLTGPIDIPRAQQGLPEELKTSGMNEHHKI